MSGAARVQVFFRGRVQGVGFRYTAKRVSAGFSVTGAVRNLSDGRVELVAEGARAELEAFLEALGERMAGNVADRELNWSESRGEFGGFEIRL